MKKQQAKSKEKKMIVKEHTGVSRYNNIRTHNRYSAECPFCGNVVVAVRDAFRLTTGKKCSCGATVCRKSAYIDFKPKVIFRSQKVDSFLNLPQEEVVKICTYYSYTGDFNFIASKYDIYKGIVGEQIIKWLRISHIMKKVKENLHLTEIGLKMMNRPKQ